MDFGCCDGLIRFFWLDIGSTQLIDYFCELGLSVMWRTVGSSGTSER